MGAPREVYTIDGMAYNVSHSTFVLQSGTDSNATKYQLQDIPTLNNCWIIVYNELAGVNNAFDTDWSYDDYDDDDCCRRYIKTVAATNKLAGVGLESVEEVCNCVPPIPL